MTERHISRLGQIQVYIGKCFRVFQNEKGWKVFISSILITILIGGVISEDTFLSYKDTKSSAFAFMSACVWIGIFNSIRSICRERDIIKREHRAGLHMSSYVAAHMIYEAVICLVEAICVVLVVWAFTGQNLPERGPVMYGGAELFVTFFLILYSSDGLGLLISSIVKNENTAMTVMPFALIIQLIMSGMIFELHGLQKACSALTISRWGLNAICITADVNSMTYSRDSEYLFSAGKLMGLWGYLLAFALVYGVLSFIALQFVDNDKR